MLNKGLNALDKVDYDTAFLEFMLGAEMGNPTFQHNLAIFRNKLETGTQALESVLRELHTKRSTMLFGLKNNKVEYD